MPGATTEAPSVALSFANNFWGKDDAGVGPLLERMHAAKQTCDELKSFYSGASLYGILVLKLSYSQRVVLQLDARSKTITQRS